jgi:hypothetical protein
MGVPPVRSAFGRGEDSTSGGHPTDRQPGNEQRNKTVEKQGLSRVTILHIRPDERQYNSRRRAIEKVDRRGRTEPVDVENRPKQSLSDNQHLSDHERPRQTTAQRLTAQETQQTPNADCCHKQQHRRREPVVNEQNGGQRITPSTFQTGPNPQCVRAVVVRSSTSSIAATSDTPGPFRHAVPTVAPVVKRARVGGAGSASRPARPNARQPAALAAVAPGRRARLQRLREPCQPSQPPDRAGC